MVIFLITGSDTLTFLMLLVDTSKINMKGGKQPQLKLFFKSLLTSITNKSLNYFFLKTQEIWGVLYVKEKRQGLYKSMFSFCLFIVRCFLHHCWVTRNKIELLTEMIKKYYVTEKNKNILRFFKDYF